MILPLIAVTVMSLISCPAVVSNKTEREHERLIGAVKTINVETAKLSRKSGKLREGRYNQERTIDYDRQGNKSKETIYTNSPTITHITYRYDADGNRTDSVIIENYQGPGSRNVLGTYREGDDRATEITSHVFKYDADGNRLEEKISSVTKVTRLLGTGILELNRHVYDAKGNRIATSYFSDGMPMYKWEFTNDDKGNVVRMTKHSRDGYALVTEAYTYEFDATGNWTKRFTFKEKKKSAEPELEPREVTYRTITYH